MTDDVMGDEPRLPREPDPEEVRRTVRALFWKRVAQGSLVAAMALILVFSAVGVYLIRHTQVDNRTTLKQAKNAAASAKATAARIEDCTTPGGGCFERAQRQTSGAVAGINTITVRVSACTIAITRQYPAGAKVNVDDVAAQIQRCIQSTTVTVKPQRVVPAPKSTVKPTQTDTTTSSSTPKHPKKHKHPKGVGTSGVPTPTPSTGPGLIDARVLCQLLLISPCPLT